MKSWHVDISTDDRRITAVVTDGQTEITEWFVQPYDEFGMPYDATEAVLDDVFDWLTEHVVFDEPSKGG